MAELSLNTFLEPPDERRLNRFDLKKAPRQEDGHAAIVWLHAGSGVIAHSRYVHSFPTYKTNRDGETYLNFGMTYVSPESDRVCEQQYFRESKESDSPMKVPPSLDPFLLLREWLRNEINSGRMSPEQIVFRWKNPKAKDNQNPIIEWKAGHLSRLEKRGRMTGMHSLDAKLEYIFLLVDNDAPDQGVQQYISTKGLGKALRDEIQRQIKSDGVEEGNPLLNPYALRFVYNPNASSPNDFYSVGRYNRARLTDEISELIHSQNYPDVERICKPRDDEKLLIRSAMEAAAEIELPLDLLFNTGWQTENPYSDDDTEPQTPSVDSSVDSEDSGDEPEIEPLARPDEDEEPKVRRRKKVKKEENPPVRRKRKKVKTIPCDDCGFQMLETWNSCPSCGCEYEEGIDPPSLEKLASANHPGAKEALKKQAPDSDDDSDEVQCFACGTMNASDAAVCTNCGTDLTDDLFDGEAPF